MGLDKLHMVKSQLDIERAEFKAAADALCRRLDREELRLVSGRGSAICETQSGHELAALPQSRRRQKRSRSQMTAPHPFELKSAFRRGLFRLLGLK